MKSRQTHPSTAMDANVVAAVSSILRMVDLKLRSESWPRPRSSSALSRSNWFGADSPGVREKYLAARRGTVGWTPTGLCRPTRAAALKDRWTLRFHNIFREYLSRTAHSKNKNKNNDRIQDGNIYNHEANIYYQLQCDDVAEAEVSGRLVNRGKHWRFVYQEKEKEKERYEEEKEKDSKECELSFDQDNSKRRSI